MNETVIVTLTVSGNGHTGTGPMRFELRGERIARLGIIAQEHV
jgi:hypothetical protein